MHDKEVKPAILGRIVFPETWTVFGPVEGVDAPVSPDAFKALPADLTVGGVRLTAQQVATIRNQYDFKQLYGDPPYTKPRSVFVCVPISSPEAQTVTLGAGADWFYRVWVNGAIVLDLMEAGNGAGRPAINNHLIDARLQAGDNLVVVHLVNGKGGPILALGGPEELRKGDFRSILPPADNELDAAQLVARYPAAPDAPLSWAPPAEFDPRQPGLGLPVLEAAEHVELLHCRKSHAPLDEGGTGLYESLEHGTWNHNIKSLLQFQDRLIGLWDNHALDENGPGGRVLARVGKIIDDQGRVDWTPADSLIEPAPPAVPVRRRKLVSDTDAIRGAQAGGTFYVIGERLFFCGRLSALHGVTDMPRNRNRDGQVLPAEHFFFGRDARCPQAGFASWDLGMRFFQEWAIQDERLAPVSPLYKENALPAKLRLTPDLELPLEPLVAPYAQAPLLASAPEDFRALVLNGARRGVERVPQQAAGTERQAADGNNGITVGHGTQFQHRDGTWTAIIENKAGKAGPFYYGAQRPDSQPGFPLPCRTNLFGGVKPAAGELPDGRNYIVGNSPNRQNMYLTVSADGRIFDRTWLLMHRRLADFTPGAMKNEGSPGSGPQYFKATVIGQSLWIIYSIAKEHVGASRIPLPAI